MPKKVLMVEPVFFDVKYAINAHMIGPDGKLNTIDKALATKQWQAVKSAYENLGFSVVTIPPQDGLPDMVFTANQTLPMRLNGRNRVVLSHMANPERVPEVARFAQFFRDQGYATLDLPTGITFEGTGDGLWDYKRETLFCGYGFRTSGSVPRHLRTLTDSDVIPLELVDDRFYHLDTALVILSSKVAGFVPEAFSPDAVGVLEDYFERLIPISLPEALNFAANAHCPDESHVLIQAGSPKFCAELKKQGYSILELDTSEYMKAGGSVFCMKLMFW